MNELPDAVEKWICERYAMPVYDIRGRRGWGRTILYDVLADPESPVRRLIDEAVDSAYTADHAYNSDSIREKNETLFAIHRDLKDKLAELGEDV